jgi:PAS domain S-box-containing protein
MALDYHGVRLDEWRQMSRGSVTHPDDSERVKATQDSALASGSAYEVELRLRKHDGSYRWFLARYNPVRDDKGQITHWYITCTDIEDRKQGLNVFPIEIPSLRERRADIPLLVEYFIDRYARKAGKNIKRVSKKTLELLQSYPWPGNIRELQNVIERSVILCETAIFSIDESWLPQQPLLAAEPNPQVELPRRLLAQEKEMIEAALKESRGRIFGPKGAAAKLGIPRSTLESKIRSLKINKNREFEELSADIRSCRDA